METQTKYQNDTSHMEHIQLARALTQICSLLYQIKLSDEATKDGLKAPKVRVYLLFHYNRSFFWFFSF